MQPLLVTYFDKTEIKETFCLGVKYFNSTVSVDTVLINQQTVIIMYQDNSNMHSDFPTPTGRVACHSAAVESFNGSQGESATQYLQPVQWFVIF